MRLYFFTLAQYSAIGWAHCEEVDVGRTNQGLALRCVISSAAATAKVGILLSRI